MRHPVHLFLISCRQAARGRYPDAVDGDAARRNHRSSTDSYNEAGCCGREGTRGEEVFRRGGAAAEPRQRLGRVVSGDSLYSVTRVNEF